MTKVLILIGGHLCTAPRPQKEADTLTMAGCEVMVAGVWFEPELVERDRLLLTTKSWQFHPVLDFRPDQPSRLGVRLHAKISRQLYRYFGLRMPALLGYGARRLEQFARRYQADITIVHSEAGLWVGQRLLQSGYSVGVDFEDWFSQDLLPSARRSRPVEWIAQLEGELLRNCSYRLATSDAMAQALAHHYEVTPPTVIYNVFPYDRSLQPLSSGASLSECSLSGGSLSGGSLSGTQTNKRIRLHWFSQTIGPGRGLELLFEALSHLPPLVEIHLRGNCAPANRTWLTQQIPPGWASHIHIHATVPNGELPARIAENDIGLALETDTILSRDLTVTNKLFQYMQAGLAIIATNTSGQREIFSATPAIGRLVSDHNPMALAAAIQYFTDSSERLQAAKAASRKAAETTFCWQIEALKMTSLMTEMNGVGGIAQSPLPDSPLNVF